MTTKYPVLPLRNTVVFPGVSFPIKAGRPTTIRAVEAAWKDSKLLLAIAQRDPNGEAKPDNLYSMGVLVRIGKLERSLRGMDLVVYGVSRARVVRYQAQQEEGYLQAELTTVKDYPPIDENDITFAAMHKELRERAVQLGKQRGVPDEMLENILETVKEPGQFADLIASYLEVPVSEQQALLESLSVEERMRSVHILVRQQIELLKAQAEIKSKVEENLSGRHREAYLREQLKTIQEELGENDTKDEIEELRRRLQELTLPEQARQEVNRELKRLGRIGNESMEAQVIRTYLDWISELPWNTRTTDNLESQNASCILDEDHYGLHDVKDRILEFLAVRQLRAQRTQELESETTIASANKEKSSQNDRTSADPTNTAANPEDEQPIQDKTEKRELKSRALAKGPILLFIGPPGVGKSSIAKSIARALEREFVRISLGGVHDEADIRGHRRTYVGAMPGRILQGLKQAGTKNPVFLLDEVDKLGASYHGNPASALLEVLDPVQNDAFTDHYLNLEFDLSEVLFIATANYIQNIPAPLLDRMEVVEFSGYTEQEKTQIAKRYLVKRQLDENALDANEIAFSDAAVRRIIVHYTRESGVRQLERTIGAVARKLARKRASGASISKHVTPKLVRRLIGKSKIHPERANKQSEVGVATGMYYSPMGGDIMFVEASIRRLVDKPLVSSGEQQACGQVSLILTGHLGDVMQESARAALTYATAHACELNIAPDLLGSLEVHIHVPAGAIPKDGPSAGVAIATAIASAMSRRPVRGDIAMTGEITLSGRVLAIGGVKEKVLGAHRAGIKEIILPKDNQDDLEDIPKSVRDKLKIHTVSTLLELLQIVIQGIPKQAESDHKAA